MQDILLNSEEEWCTEGISVCRKSSAFQREVLFILWESRSCWAGCPTVLPGLWSGGSLCVWSQHGCWSSTLSHIKSNVPTIILSFSVLGDSYNRRCKSLLQHFLLFIHIVSPTTSSTEEPMPALWYLWDSWRHLTEKQPWSVQKHTWTHGPQSSGNCYRSRFHTLRNLNQGRKESC